ncbi:hypothetical protein GEV33_001071 [Tenebrio molitor]|uniref:Uncharacterized protein n=1 Tax=Tenebrio molitor TaxID=7067 RepID=A0A8J6LH29_TENMO|nr:hypothetical protein GEV33_001071 [Tenebrio molitor]
MLRQNFIPKRDLSNMFACVPKAHQSLYEYAFEKLALIHQLGRPGNPDNGRPLTPVVPKPGVQGW